MGCDGLSIRQKVAIPLIDVDAAGALRAFHLLGGPQGDQPERCATSLEAHDVIVKRASRPGAYCIWSIPCRCCPSGDALKQSDRGMSLPHPCNRKKAERARIVLSIETKAAVRGALGASY